MRIALLVTAVLLAGFTVAVATGVWFWRRATALRIEQLRAAIVEPDRCEVAWMGSDGPEPYWRGRISTIEYEFWPSSHQE
jgi:hypothetical protein